MGAQLRHRDLKGVISGGTFRYRHQAKVHAPFVIALAETRIGQPTLVVVSTPTTSPGCKVITPRLFGRYSSPSRTNPPIARRCATACAASSVRIAWLIVARSAGSSTLGAGDHATATSELAASVPSNFVDISL